MLDAQNTRLSTSLDAKTAEIAHEQAWYRSPSFTVPTFFVLGIVAGLYVTAGKR